MNCKKITEIKDKWIEYQATGGCTFAVYICTREGREFFGHYELGEIDDDGQWRGDAEGELRDENSDWSDLSMREAI